VAPSHGTGLVTDLDGDGRDELIGGMVVGPTVDPAYVRDRPTHNCYSP
jgi:hypothetical protein